MFLTQAKIRCWLLLLQKTIDLCVGELHAGKCYTIKISKPHYSWAKRIKISFFIVFNCSVFVFITTNYGYQEVLRQKKYEYIKARSKEQWLKLILIIILWKVRGWSCVLSERSLTWFALWLTGLLILSNLF